jgi:outer membrane protein
VANAQKVGYLDTRTILAQIPEYNDATRTLERLSKQYQQYIETEKSKIDQAYKKYQSDRPRLSESARKVREDEIINMERQLQAKQKEYFGEGGVMASKSEQMLNPIKAKVDAAVRKVAQKYGYSMIIDLSAVQGVVYHNEADDLSLEVIRNL